MDSIQFGRRVNYWRTRRRISRADFAALMGKSLRWVEELEGGRRQADPNWSVMVLAARHLGITVDRLMSEVIDTECAGESDIEAVRRVLQRHDVITGSFDRSSTEPHPVQALRRSLAYARTGFQAGHFAQLGSELPKLLVDAARAAHHHRGDDRLGAYEVLSLCLELTEAAAIKWGDSQLAVVAGHRAVTAAEQSENPVTMASAARHLGDAMTNHGEAAAAATVVLAAARRLEEDLLHCGPDGYSVLGMLYLKAAMAAAAAAEADDRAPARFARRVPDYLDEADEHAARLGGDENRLWTSFGPTNVSLYRVASHVYLSEGADAVAVAAGIPADAFNELPRERRAHLLTDRAIGEKQAGLREKAVDTLLEADELAPEEVRCRPRTRWLVEDLRVLGVRSAEGRLRMLADRCGLPR
ncbi:helix-turn-helix transcriptional regulator [Streptomyces sp. NA02950]|uniref:helix-turn-helix domain-containing protein n=1 Tax=Streptomyces sp. NA02950 TaxID=2742137 RepID=UPI0015922658|nr:helix-turn-helix transcriptional regulator [Streptomyces sp. NA02950]QKV97119.1 helix-turn-helix transcriptional regulator [Streptomyces sp. NA02950]